MKEDALMMDEVVKTLEKSKGPLYIDNITGKEIKKIMLSPAGKRLRNHFPEYEPWCGLFPAGIVILSDGAVTTCCLDALGSNTYANIFDQDIAEIWAKDTPAVLEHGLYDLAACKECIGNPGLSSLISEKEEYQAWKSILSGHPRELIIEVMSNCNYGCCVAKELHRYRRMPKLDLPKLFERIKIFLSVIKRLKLFNYGEPLLNEGFCEFVGRCRCVSPELIMTLATNGMLLDEEIATCLVENRFNQVVISVHGGPGTENMLKYSHWGADYPQVINNIKRLIELRTKYQSTLPKISLRAILFAWNDSDEIMEWFRRDAQDLGLQATWGNVNTDNYHWILDEGRGGRDRSSGRFTPNSKDLEELIFKKEYFVREFW